MNLRFTVPHLLGDISFLAGNLGIGVLRLRHLIFHIGWCPVPTKDKRQDLRCLSVFLASCHLYLLRWEDSFLRKCNLD